MIPKYYEIMLPYLNLLADKQEHKHRDLIEQLADQLSLTPEDRKALLPSGGQYMFDNRVGWSRTYMSKALLLQSPKRGHVQITDRGLEALSKKPDKIDVKFLMQYEEFREFRALRRENGPQEATEEHDTDRTPEEALDAAYFSIRQALIREILDKVKACSPAFFEKLVVELLVAMGYGGSIGDAGRAVGGSGDEGIDGIIKEDRLGLDIIYIQAKRWQSTVARAEIQKFVGALQGKRAKKGVFITTSDFNSNAIEYASNLESKVVLIDGEQIANYMIDFNVGVSRSNVYEIKKLDSDYFEEG